MRSGWMMNRKKINDTTGGFLLLMIILLGLNLVIYRLSLHEPDSGSDEGSVFVQISGEVKCPGVYSFHRPPFIRDLLTRAGGLSSKRVKELPVNGPRYQSGADVEVRADGKELRIFAQDMSAFYKIALGVPISLNRECAEALTAVPGIGPGRAGAIVRERARRGGFKHLDEILSIQGIGPEFYKRMSPYLTL